MPLYLQFYVWLMAISGGVFVLERCFAARRDQEVLREGFVQDLYWMVLNTQFVSWMLGIAAVRLVTWINRTCFHWGWPAPESMGLIARWPWYAQFIVFFTLKDFLEWNIHRLMHLSPVLWRFHALHHSSDRLDWASTFRAHWGEIVIYKFCLFLPLVVLGVDDRVVFAILACSLLVQELAHANLNWDWGPLRYVINSPRLHAWHHSVELHGRGGQNFGISLVIWDWLFCTVYWPGKKAEGPARLGFEGVSNYPRGFWNRLWAPFRRRF